MTTKTPPPAPGGQHLPLLLPETSLWANRKCLVICAVVAMANMQFGLDTAVVGSLQAMPGFLKVFGHPDPSAPGGYAIGGTFQQLISSLLTLGALLSSLGAGLLAQLPGPAWLGGRRPALGLGCLLTAAGCALQLGTTSAGVVYLGRLVLGLGNGLLVTCSNIYVAEAAPPHLRAVLVALYGEWVNVGSVVGAVVANATQAWPGKRCYQVPLAVLFVVPAVLGAALWFVPESPRYLVHRGQLAAGRAALATLRGVPGAGRGAVVGGPEALELEWVEMVRGIREEAKTATTVGPRDLFTDRRARRRTLLCYSVRVSQAGSGVWFVISYSTYFLVVGGLSTPAAFRYSVMNTCLCLVGVNVGIFLMRHVCGRRTIMWVGATLQGLAMLGLAVGASANSVGSRRGNNCLVAFVALFQFTFNASLGAASYPVATELVSTRLRSWTVGSAVSLGNFFAWLAAFCSPYFINPDYLNWGAKYGYLWAGSNFACALFFFFFLPELKGRTLEEIDELFAREVPAWRFKTYQTTIQDEALAEVRERGRGRGRGRQEGIGEKTSSNDISNVEEARGGDHIKLQKERSN